MTCHISSELTPRRRKTQSVEVGGPNAKDVALGKASQPGDAGGIVISLNAVSGQFPSGDNSDDGTFIEARIGPMVMSLLVGSRPRRIHMLDWHFTRAKRFPSGL